MVAFGVGVEASLLSDLALPHYDHCPKSARERAVARSRAPNLLTPEPTLTYPNLLI